MDEPRDAQLGVSWDARSDESPDESQPDVRSAEEAEFPRHDADEADCDGCSDADGDCVHAAGVEAEEAGVRSPDPMCRR